MTGRLKQLLRHIQPEDVALVVILIATPLLAPITDLLPVFGPHDSFFGGLVSFLAAVSAIAALATRVPTDPDRPEPAREGEIPARMWLVGPFIGAVGFVAGDSLDRMGLPGGDALIVVAFAVAVVSFVFASRLPVVSRYVRRLLVGPFVLLSSAFLQQFAATITSSFAGTDVLGQVLAVQDLGLIATLLAFVALVALVFYLMLVFAPRELADPGASSISWAVRFALFFVSLVTAILAGSAGPLLVA